MTIEQKIQYNKESSKKYGWSPEWLNEIGFTLSLIKSIENFQNQNFLSVDGLVGPNTYRKLYTNHQTTELKINQTIIVNNKNIPITWNKVINLQDVGSLLLPKSCYKKSWTKRKVSQFVIHWDSTFSSHHCYNILKKRGLSVHFEIDNDGTIYQFVDTNHICWHAPDSNYVSVGVEMSNAVYPLKYQDWYDKNGFGKRPILTGFKCHKTIYPPFLGFYPIQIEALKALLKTVCSHYSIPLQVPLDPSGNLINTVYPPAEQLQWSGILAHYHLSYKKWDVAGLDLKQVVSEIK